MRTARFIPARTDVPVPIQVEREGWITDKIDRGGEAAKAALAPLTQGERHRPIVDIRDVAANVRGIEARKVVQTMMDMMEGAP